MSSARWLARVVATLVVVSLLVVGGPPAGPAAARSDEGGTLSGTAYDLDGEPLANVHIQIWRLLGGGSVTDMRFATTGADGTYRIDDVVPGLYDVYFDGGSVGLGLFSHYYDGAMPEYGAEATAVTVEAGQETAGIDSNFPAAHALASAPGSISGTVTDGDGLPLDGVQVEVVDLGVPLGDDDPFTVVATTDETGSYQSEGLAPGQYLVRFTPEPGSGLVWTYYDGVRSFQDATPVVVVGGSDTPGIDAVLAASGAISGQVLDGGGQPLEGVTVSASGYQGHGSAVTDADGLYRIGTLPAGDYVVHFDGSSVGLLGQYYDGVLSSSEATPVVVAAGVDTTDIDAVLSAGGGISGRVTDEDGQPVEGVEVSASGYSAWKWAVTDADGLYRIETLPPGDYVVHFGDPSGRLVSQYYDGVSSWFEATPVAVADGVDTTDIDATLVRGGSISGTVTVPDGVDLEDAIICAYGETTTLCNASDPSGDYTIPGLPAGEYVVSFNIYTSEGYSWQYYDGTRSLSQATPVVVAPGEDVTGIDAVVTAAGGISGRVTDGNGDPIEGVEVSAMGYWDSGWAVTGADGRYRIGGLGAGDYTVHFDGVSAGVSSEYYDGVTSSAAATPVPVVAGVDTVDVDAQLARAGSISGTISVPDGHEMVEAFVCAQDATSWFTIHCAYSDPSTGAYTITDLPAGQYIVSFLFSTSTGLSVQYYDGTRVWEEATPVEVAEGAQVTGIDVTWAPSATGAISGRVTDGDGEPVAGIVVTVEEWWLGTGGQAVTDEDGLYHVGGLPGGSYSVHFSGAEVGYADEYYDDVAGVGTPTPVDVVDGEETTGIDAVIDRLATLSGTITVDEGVTDVVVCVLSSTVNRCQDVPAGPYEQAVPAGEYRVYAEGWAPGWGWVWSYYDGTQLWEEAVVLDVEPGQVVSGLDLHLGEPSDLGSISGRVTDTDGEPIAGVTVSGSTEWEPPATATTDANGEYTIVGLSAGDYWVHFDGTAVGYSSEVYDDHPWYVTSDDPTPVTVVAGEVTSGIDADLDPLGLISGTLTVGEDLQDEAYVCATSMSPYWSKCVARAPDGTYQVPVPAGEYRVYFEGYDQDWIGTGLYYDGTPSWEEAVVLTVDWGQEVSGIDGHLGEVPVIDGSISGTVTVDGGVAAGIQVCAWAEAPGELCTDADADGSYELAVPPGDYRVSFVVEVEGSDALWAYYDGTQVAGEATTVTVGPGEHVSGIDARFEIEVPDPVSLSGTVTSSAGGPIAGAQVQVFPAGSATRLTTVVTGADGTFTVEDLPPGLYKVRVGASGHVTEWHEDRPNIHTADPVWAEPGGGDVLAVELAAVSQLATLTGQVSDGQGPAAGVAVQLFSAQAAQQVRTATTAGDGTYTFSELAPGSYRIRLVDPSGQRLTTWIGGSSWSTATTLTVPGATVTTVNGTMVRPAAELGTVSGLVDGGGTALAGASVQLFDSTGTRVRTVSTGGDGSYLFTDVAPGAYRVRAGDPSGAHLLGWYGGASSIRDATPITVTAGGSTTGVDVSLVAVSNLAAITGTVSDGVAGVAGVQVHVYTPSLAHVGWTLTGPGGVFTLADLDAGEYLVRIVDPAGSFPKTWYEGASSWRQATRVALAPGQLRVLDLAVPVGV